MNPTILIGLDGATFTILDILMARGLMPNLQAFIKEGVRAELLSTPHPLTPPAWTTLITGQNPGRHGIFDFLRTEVREDRAFFTLNNFRDIHCETLWTLVSRLGGRVLAVNYPMTAPPPAVNGVIIPGLLNWRHLRRNVYPPEIYDTLKALPGFDPREISCDIEVVTATLYMKDEELAPWIRSHIISSDQHWFGILRCLMQTEPSDLTVVVFDGVDKIQHACWRFLDPAFTPKQPTEVEQTLWDLSLDYFRQLDDFIGQLVSLAGPNANIFFASDHGFGPSLMSFRVNKWLEQQGLLFWPTGDSQDRAARNTHFVHLDWKKTVAYAPSAPTNGIHLRVQQAPGAPGIPREQYGPLRARLVEQLRALRDPETDNLILKDILLREQVFPGAHMDKAPDLTLVPFDHSFVSVLNAEPIFCRRSVVWGTHYPVGILLGRGPAIPKGRVLERQSILDVAPTLLHSLGLRIPEDFEGKVIQDAFDVDYLHAHPIRKGPPTEMPRLATAPRVDHQVQAAEEEGILERLRALGYVE